LAHYFAEFLRSDQREVVRMCHMLLGNGCGGYGGMGHVVELDILRYSASTGALDPDRALTLSPDRLSKGPSGVWLGEIAIDSLSDLPTDMVIPMSNERGQDGFFWLERSSESDVITVHFVQVKGGKRDRDMGIICGRSPEATNDTLASVTGRMLLRSWPDVQCALNKAAIKSKRTVKLGRLMLLTTRFVDPKAVKRFAALAAKESWLLVDNVRHTLEVLDDVDKIVPEANRRYYQLAQ
jgi:hypothetical protein